MADAEAPLSNAPVKRWRPGDRRVDTESMLRVDQAGEYGATRIYAGQLAVLRGSSPAAHLVTHMAGQEDRHLARFNHLMAERRVRPTLLQPLWHVGGFALGAVTALISEEAAMACTDAVETEIDRHYEEQLVALGEDDPELAADIRQFQAEELEHRDTAREAGAMNAPAYPLLTFAIRGICRAAIQVSKRI
ncbi:demethoxyubiquinone hydroxylase family protein [Sphingomonas sp. BN140010]|uniref:3-demethoxyubiquinol 3-hydroxylase n=1 Tax=Sphingomonas arvum TaxID=2992113 RepID=A0ABT3JBU0_9SPHN|nr:demethoxyubiquinone hydroxylase family protein [Sphingomonas sp. BN140010]MCW3796384.1 demethoxyubiquinone hydroxylase family protein [Sphingomonas sp. BN140010]